MKRRNLKFIGVSAMALTLAFSTGAPLVAKAEIFTEPPAYMDVIELVDENGNYIYIESSNEALINAEIKRIEEAIAARDNGGEDVDPEPVDPKPEDKDPVDGDAEDKAEAPEKEDGKDNAGSDKGKDESIPVKEGKVTEKSNPSSKANSKDVAGNKGSTSNSSTPGKTEVTSKTEVAKKQVAPKNTYKVKSVSKDTTVKFIEKVSTDIKAVADENGIYSSVMIAQALLATNSGESYLASENMNNIMGIKGSFEGKSISLNSSEGKQNYRQYDSVSTAFADYVKLVNKDIYKASLKANSKTYKEATKAIATHYAVDSEYESKLNSVIELYDLTQFDK